jgi:hypothetical protein
VGVAPLTNGGDGEWLQVQAKHFIMASVIYICYDADGNIMGSAGQGQKKVQRPGDPIM